MWQAVEWAIEGLPEVYSDVGYVGMLTKAKNSPIIDMAELSMLALKSRRHRSILQQQRR
jgi:hypothetical protein